MVRRWLLPWAIGSVAFGGASLVVPLYVVEIGGGAFALGILAAAAAVAGVPGALVVGRGADQGAGGQRTVRVCLSLAAVSLLAMAFVDALAPVVVINGLIWFAYGAAMPAMTVLAIRGVPDHEWSEHIGTLNQFQGIGWALGLGFGLVWTAFGDRYVAADSSLQTLLLGLGVVAVVGVVSSYRFLPAGDGRPVSAPRLRRAIGRADRFTVRAVTFPVTLERADFRGLRPGQFARRFTPRLATYFVAVALVFTGFSVFFAPLPAFLTDAGLGSDAVFGLYLLSSLTSAACFGYVGRLAGRFDPLGLQVGGLAIRGIAFPTVAVVVAVLGVGAVGVVGLGLTFGVIGLTWAVINVTGGTLVVRLTPPAIRGESLGMYASLGALAGGIGSLLGGWVGSISYVAAFLLAGGLIAVGAGLVLTLR